jgi:HSP20 family protein
MTDKEKKELQLRDKEPIAKGDGEPTRAGLVYSPAVDIVRSDDAITLIADLPGVKRADLEIRIEDGVLSIAAPVAEVEARHRPVYREYGIGGYARRFAVSDKIDASKIGAELANGVLTVTLPKAERLKPRRIEIAG